MERSRWREGDQEMKAKPSHTIAYEDGSEISHL